MNLAGKLGSVVLVLLAAQGRLCWGRGWEEGGWMLLVGLGAELTVLNKGMDGREDLRVSVSICRICQNKHLDYRTTLPALPNSACFII